MGQCVARMIKRCGGESGRAIAARAVEVWLSAAGAVVGVSPQDSRMGSKSQTCAPGVMSDSGRSTVGTIAGDARDRSAPPTALAGHTPPSARRNRENGKAGMPNVRVCDSCFTLLRQMRNDKNSGALTF